MPDGLRKGGGWIVLLLQGVERVTGKVKLTRMCRFGHTRVSFQSDAVPLVARINTWPARRVQLPDW